MSRMTNRRKKWLSLTVACTIALTSLIPALASADETASAAEAAEMTETTDMAATSADASAEEAAASDTTGAVTGTQADAAFYDAADLSVLDGAKIGVTIQSLQNAYWAGVMSALEEVVKEQGADITIVACDDNSATQIGQIENFMNNNCDLIMVHPSDAAAVEDVCAEVREAGIKVMCWDDPMTNTDGNWILNNTDLGIAIGELTGSFIVEHYDETNPAQVAVLDYPQTKVLLERGEGIKQGLENAASGKYEIIAEQPAIEANKAQDAMETILVKNPDCKVVAGVGAGAMIGANEALVINSGGNIPDDMGVFSTDVTKQQLEQLMDPGQASKGIIGFEGSDYDTAKACMAMYALILGDGLEGQNVFREVKPITEENAQAIMDEMK